MKLDCETRNVDLHSSETDAVFDSARWNTSELSQWVIDATTRWNQSAMGASDGLAGGCAPRLRGLLGVLVYCYAAGIYASQDIEFRLANDGLVRLWPGARLWNERVIRRFRREHKEVVIRCLERVLELATRGSGSAARPVNGARLDPTMVGDWRGPRRLAVASPAAMEARRRVDWAVFLDSTALDE